jgi:hypothetical protein
MLGVKFGQNVDGLSYVLIGRKAVLAGERVPPF